MIKKLIRQIVRPRYEKIKQFSVVKQKTVISEPTLPKNNDDCSVEQNIRGWVKKKYTNCFKSGGNILDQSASKY